MTSTRPLLVIGLLALALLVPSAQAQAEPGIKNPTASTETTLFFHLNGFQNFPINTQKPDDSFAEAAGVGLATHTGTCIPDNPASGPLAGHKYHTYYGYSSPGYVEYNVTEDGKPRFHPERGLSYDILFDTAAPFTLKWFLSTNSGVPSPGGVPNVNQAPIVIPSVAVRATLRTGDEITIGDEGYNSGQIIAQGVTAPATLAGQATQGATYHQVGDQNVYEFDVPMAFQANSIPKDGGYSLRVDVFIKSDGSPCNDNPDQSLMPNLVRTFTAPDLRPRMMFSITDPIRIEYMHPQFIGDDLVLHTSSNSPWGNYDVDETVADSRGTLGGITVVIEGPSEARSLYRAAVVQRYHEHDHHTQAVDVSYIWPYKEDAAKDGVYTVTMTVKNDQGTAEAVGVARFEIGKDLKVTRCGGLDSVDTANSNEKCESEVQDINGNPIDPNAQDSPAFQLVGVLAILGLAAVAVRRRTA